MNDNDIIKALEFCESPTCECTGECPMFNNGTNCISDCRGELHKNALDLINRQKAEIADLKAKKKICAEVIARQDKEIESLSKAVDNYESCLKSVEVIRANAIKEFAEKLKENISNMEYRANVQRKTVSVETLYTQVNWVFHEIVSKTIDNLMKEMTEDEDGNV